MKTSLIMAALAIAAAAAGAYGWLQHQEHAQTRSALNAANSELQKSRAELNTAAECPSIRRGRESGERPLASGNRENERGPGGRAARGKALRPTVTATSARA